MKKLLTILMLFISFFCYSQVENNFHGKLLVGTGSVVVSTTPGANWNYLVGFINPTSNGHANTDALIGDYVWIETASGWNLESILGLAVEGSNLRIDVTGDVPIGTEGAILRDPCHFNIAEISSNLEDAMSSYCAAQINRNKEISYGAGIPIGAKTEKIYIDTSSTDGKIFIDPINDGNWRYLKSQNVLTNISASTTLVNEKIVFVTASSNYTIFLPTPSSRIFENIDFRREDENEFLVTISGTGLNRILMSRANLSIISDGVTWRVK